MDQENNPGLFDSKDETRLPVQETINVNSNRELKAQSSYISDSEHLQQDPWGSKADLEPPISHNSTDIHGSQQDFNNTESFDAQLETSRNPASIGNYSPHLLPELTSTNKEDENNQASLDIQKNERVSTLSFPQKSSYSPSMRTTSSNSETSTNENSASANSEISIREIEFQHAPREDAIIEEAEDENSVYESDSTSNNENSLSNEPESKKNTDYNRNDDDYQEELEFPEVLRSESRDKIGSQGKISQMQMKRPLSLRSINHWRKKSIINRHNKGDIINSIEKKDATIEKESANLNSDTIGPITTSNEQRKTIITVEATPSCQVKDSMGKQHYSRMNPKLLLSRVTGNTYDLEKFYEDEDRENKHTESVEPKNIEDQTLLGNGTLANNIDNKQYAQGGQDGDGGNNGENPGSNDGSHNVHFLERERNSSHDGSEKGHGLPTSVRRPSLAALLNNYMESENIPGFVGLAAVALAEVPSPSNLLDRKRQLKKDEEAILEATISHAYEPTPAAEVQFEPEHTFKEIQIRRFKILKYLLHEYTRLGVRYVLTPKGFIVTIYFMLIVAFGGMLFLLLCNAAPAMSREWGPDDKEHSPRQIWIEIDSQVINALFCVTGLGLFPMRIRDFYMYIVGTYRKDSYCRRKILRTHSSWFLSDYSAEWKLITVILLYIMNSVFQVLLCVAMWRYNRFNRPPWVTGVLIAASFSCVIVAGIITFWEARRVRTLGVISQNKS